MPKELQIREMSGCLEIIGGYAESEKDLQETFYQWAAAEWDNHLNRCDSNLDFKTYYGLTKAESKKFLNKETMPESFIEKYRKFGSCYKISYDSRFLWHKTQPNTRDFLNDAYRKKKLYKVKCHICGRIFYMDATSFTCVSWSSCVGAECLATTVAKVNVDYTKSLYEWKVPEKALQIVDEPLAQVDASFDNSLTYYGDGREDGLRIAYISDLHLHHHLKYYDDNEERMIEDIVNKLSESLERMNAGQYNRIYAVFFGGDVSETPELTIAFLKVFRTKVRIPIFFVLGNHDHNNEYIRQEDKVLYADNQVGYENNNIAFKEATTGLISNPYREMMDGLYQTSVDDYLTFNRYLGEYVGDGNLLYRRCQNGTLYVVKRKEYYGFFIISTKRDSKGISIVNGGMTKKLTSSTEISWICENFDIVVSKYLQLLLPLRKVQEELSKELQELGLDGTIHGLIVDIDYYHHIALNPMDGTMNFYYASVFGLKRNLHSFQEVIQSLEYYSPWIEEKKIKSIQQKYEEKENSKGYLLGGAFSNTLLTTESYEPDNASQRAEQIVSRKEGMYGVSRKISGRSRENDRCGRIAAV